MLPIGTTVRLTNPQSVFHGRCGVLVAVVWPDMPNPAVVVRLLSDDRAPLLCYVDELEVVTDTPT